MTIPCSGSFPLVALAAIILVGTTGCYSIRNSWLDPTTVGAFDRTSTTEIRTSLTLEDAPTGIPGATYPTPEDLEVRPREYTISGGDTLEVEINELRVRLSPFLAQVQVSSTGYVNLPVVGRVQAAGSTVPEFEENLRAALRDRNILVEPEVAVNPLFLQKATYSIFGIGVSAANNAPLRAGTFPIRRPDLRLLEAINQVGGLNEFVTEIYLFRYDEDGMATSPPSDETSSRGHRPGRAALVRHSFQEASTQPAGKTAVPNRANTVRPPEDELIRAVTGDASEEPPPETRTAEESEIIRTTESEPTPPYLWVNGEFVPNPAYRGATAPENGLQPEPRTFDAGAVGVNWARVAGDSNYRILNIPAESLRSGDPAWNICIRAGDVIRIVSGEIGIYYVMGQVNRVGPFAFNAEQVTLKAAIASAGGLSGLAWPDRCTIYRRLGQREQMIQVNLDRIFAGVEPDFVVKRGDIINVGTHPLAPFLQRVRAFTLPNIPNNVGYSFTYARNYADIDSFAAQQNPGNEPDLFPRLFGDR